MPVKIIESAPNAYAYPLLIKQLLHTPLATSADQEITYQGKLRYSYRTLRERIGRLANGLAGLGVEAGKTVAMMSALAVSTRWKEPFARNWSARMRTDTQARQASQAGR